ncbi:MAG: cytochrome c oxidase subunit II [Bacteroidota bacterium]
MITFLGLIVTILVIIAIARIVRILELTAYLSGENSERITEKNNNLQGTLNLVFLFVGMIFIVFTTWRYSRFILPVSASKHGVQIDNLMNVNYVLIFTVFFITQILLFVFAFKYRHNKNRRAEFIPENHKLEFVWTIIPTIVLGGMIVYGLTVWNRITNAVSNKDAQVIELYGKQFDWTARYAGKDNTLGKANFLKININNPLGVDSLDPHAKDDILVKELHLKINQPTLLSIRAQDVIHSVYMPHFRLQMNAVPGMTTQFYFVPSITTDEMRKNLNNDKFDYVLLCNKICGMAHYTMKMKVVVDDENQYAEWMNKQKSFDGTAVADNTNPIKVSAVASK